MTPEETREADFAGVLLKSRYKTLLNYLRTSTALHSELKQPVRDYAVGLQSFAEEVSQTYPLHVDVQKWSKKVLETLEQYKLLI